MAETVFPAYLRAQFQDDSGGFPAFARAAETAAQGARRSFQSSFNDIGKTISQTLTKGLNGNGAIDLNVGQFREAAAQSRAYAESLRETLSVARNLAVLTGDTSEQTRLYIQALSAQKIEAEQAARANESQVTSYTRLQLALDATATKTGALASAYRGLFAEQARSAQAEVADRRLVNNNNAATTRGVTGKSASESAEVFQALLREQDAAASATAEINRLRAAEASAAEGARILAAAHQGTALAFDASTKSARESASVFAQSFAEADKAAAAVAATAARYATSATELRTALDPMFGAQQRFDQELTRAEQLYAAGAISAREYAQAQKLATQNLQTAAQAIHAVGDAAGQGTTAYRAFGNSLGAQRVAYVQTGQQLQDIAISLYSGQRASVVFAQQIPQLAFALTYLEGSTNKTANAIGKFATFLSGPWGAAISVAALVLGPLIANLFQTVKASEEAEKAGKALAERQVDIANFFDTATGKIKENNQALIENAKLTNFLDAEKSRASQKDINRRANDLLRTSAGTFTKSAGPDAFGDPTSISVQRPTDIVDAFKNGGNVDAALNRIARSKSLNAGLAKELSDLRSQYILAGREASSFDKRLESLTTGILDATLRDPAKKNRVPKSRDGAAIPFGATEDGFSDRIQSIIAPFDDAPRTVDLVTKATNELDRVLYDIQQKKPPNMEGLVEQLNEARIIVQSGLNKPLDDYLKRAGEIAGVDNLRAQGRNDEANALQDILRLQERMGELDAQQANAVYATVIAERQRLAVIRDQRALIEANLDLLGDVRTNIEQTINGALNGRFSIVSFGERLFQSYTNALAKNLTEKLFGDSFRQLEDQILGGDKVQDASGRMATAMDLGSTAVREFANTVGSIAGALRSGANDNSEGGQIAAKLSAGNVVLNDGNDEIVVTGQRPSRGPSVGTTLSPTDLLGRIVSKLGQDIGIKKESADRLGKVFGKTIEGFAIGNAFGSILGTSGTGSKVGGAISGLASGVSDLLKNSDGSESKGSRAASQIAKAAGVIGQAFEIGKAIGGLFAPGPQASSVITSATRKPNTFGNDGNAADNIQSAALGITSSLQNVIEALGGTAGDFKVSIGQYKDNFRVSASGASNVDDKRYPKNNSGDVIYDGKDAAAATKAAILNAIQDGAVSGISEAAKRLLLAGNDLTIQVNKVIKFQNVFIRLKEATDPLGAAIDAVNKEFTGLKAIFTEAGASAAEFADLEKLYGIERAKQIKAATQEMTSAYRELLNQLTTGDNGRSLRERLTAAQATYNPLAADLAAGKTVDPGAYSDAARTLLDIQRQLYGSQPEFFALQDQVIAQLQSTLAATDAKIAEVSGAGSPFAAPVVSALDQQTTTLSSQLTAVNDNLGSIMGLLAAGGGSGGGNAGQYYGNANF
jgi:hypothetical protein